MRPPASTCTAAGAGAGILLAAGVSVAVPAGHALAYARLAILGGALGVLALHDIREHRIPNRIVLPAAMICAALSIAEGVHNQASGYTRALYLSWCCWRSASRCPRRLVWAM